MAPSRHPSFSTPSPAFDTLEARQLLAGIANLTDVDGDTYTVKLTGPGTLTVTPSVNTTTGFIQALSYAGTTAASGISISVQKAASGDGRVNLAGITGASDLKSFTGLKVDVLDSSTLSLGSLKSLALGDIGGAVAVTLQPAPLPGTAVAFRNFGVSPGSVFHARGRITSFKTETLRGELILEEGVDSISAVSVPALELEAAGLGGNLAAVGSLKVLHGLNVNAGGNGRVGQVSAGFMTAALDFTSIQSITTTTGSMVFQGAGGPVGSIKSKGSISFSGSVGAIAAITAQGPLFGELTILGQSPGGVALGLLKAPSATGLELSISVAIPTAQVKSIRVGSWQGGAIVRGTIGELRCDGDFNAAIDLSAAAAAPVSIDRIKIGGRATGLWTIPTRINTFSAFETGTGSDTNSRLRIDQGAGHLVIGEVSLGIQSQFIALTAEAVGPFQGRGFVDLIADLDGTQLMGPFTAKIRLTATVTCGNAGIRLIRSDGEILDSAFRTLFIDEVKAQSISNCLLRADGVAPTGFGVRKTTVKADAFDLRLRALGPVGLVDVGSLKDNSVIYSGSIGGNALPADLSTFDASGRIDQVKIRRSFSPINGQEAWSHSSIVAPTVGSITVSGRIDPSSFGGSEVFGVGFRTLTAPMQLRNSSGAVFIAAVPVPGADVVPSAAIGGTDFTIRHYV